jgi:hypothetical protein
VEVDRALMDVYEQFLREGACTLAQTTKQHDTQAWSRLPAVPGLGNIVRVVLLYEMPASPRVPRGQDVVSYGRRVTCATASAGKRDGTAGTQIGKASLKGACTAAALLCLRNPPAGPT